MDPRLTVFSAPLLPKGYLYAQRKHTVEEICRTLGISKPTLYAYVRGASPKP